MAEETAPSAFSLASGSEMVTEVKPVSMLMATTPSPDRRMTLPSARLATTVSPAARRQLVFAVEGGGRAFLLEAESVEEALADAVLAAQRRGDTVAGDEPENLGGGLGVRSRQCRQREYGQQHWQAKIARHLALPWL